jgi:hypothetical protein
LGAEGAFLSFKDISATASASWACAVREPATTTSSGKSNVKSLLAIGMNQLFDSCESALGGDTTVTLEQKKSAPNYDRRLYSDCLQGVVKITKDAAGTGWFAGRFTAQSG